MEAKQKHLYDTLEKIVLIVNDHMDRKVHTDGKRLIYLFICCTNANLANQIGLGFMVRLQG